MGIQALPADTIRTIGTSQVLHDARAVVKELVDNALDARATSVAIEISSNTLDSIQVRDNGHGIPAIDRNLIARLHCTSKISTENDLRLIGGSSLGFRGEALASVADSSGSLTISTRVEGEQVSTALKIDQRGAVEAHERGSLPTGTTVKVTDFMKSNPVRKQVALKNAEKNLTKVKQMLQSYAFARPGVRISFKVLKAKNESANWVYAPKPGANAEDVALKIAGTCCTSQCTWSIVEDQGYTAHAFLPKIDADGSKLSSLGCFISIDSRPISSSIGIAKQLAKLFRETLKKANSSFESVKDPFMNLQLSCPPATYDANVEPAKDDVLFEDPDIVLNLARRLVNAVYHADDNVDLQGKSVTNSSVPEAISLSSTQEPLSPGTQAALDELSSHIDLEAANINHGQAAQGFNTIPSLQEESLGGSRPLVASQMFRSIIYGCDKEDIDLCDARPPTGRTEADFEELRQAREYVNLSNPWVIAKMNAPTKRTAQIRDERQEDVMSAVRHGMANEPSVSIARPNIDLEASGLPTPTASSQSPPRSNFHPSDNVSMNRLARGCQLIDSQKLPLPQQSIDFQIFQPLSHQNEIPQQIFRQNPMYDYTISSQTSRSAAGTALNDIQNAFQNRRRAVNGEQSGNGANPPFNPPSKYQSWPKRRICARPGRKSLRPPKDAAGLVVQGQLGDLVDDPRPLTPPSHNRDMRDFVTTLDSTADSTASATIERSNYPPKKRAMSFDSAFESDNANDDENRPTPIGIPSGRGFVPTSELAALEARAGLCNNNSYKPAKRRTTSKGYVITEINPNEGAVVRGAVDMDQSTSINRTKSRPRSIASGTRAKRIKSAQQPLEYTSTEHAVRNIILSVSTSEEAVGKLAVRIDEECSIPEWKQTGVDMYAAFKDQPSPEALAEMTETLRGLLASQIAVDEMVQDFRNVLPDAFEVHRGGKGNGSST
jgi:DNA mismatch repair protein MutL